MLRREAAQKQTGILPFPVVAVIPVSSDVPMDIPGLPALLDRLTTECGIVGVSFALVAVWLAIQLVRRMKAYDTLVAEYNSSYEKLAVATAKIETMLMVVQRDTHK